jgi:hypothetical protein
MALKLSADIEKRLEAAAQARGVSEQTLIEQALEAFLTQPRRNANGFAIPSFVGSVASDDPSWIDEHENLLWKPWMNALLFHH